MARKPVTDMSAWPSLMLEGNLIAPAMVASIDRRQASEQTEEDYRIRKGLTIREEISTAFRVGQSHFDTFAKLQNASAEATRRFVRAFLSETFSFDDLTPADGVISFLAGGRVPIVVVPPSEEKLDRRSPTLSTDRSRSPAFALQDYLNDSDDALWGLVTNGTVLRLMRDNASLTRPAYIEADLAAIFTNEDAASFAVLWSLIHRTRFGVTGTPVTDCALERWREAGSREGEVARDRLATQVETALKVLGSGFLEANPDLAARLKSGEVNLTEWFNELLRLVYRLIFLMVAEDRNLLHPEATKPDAQKLYAEGYSLAALRTQAARAATWDKHHDRYEGIKIVFRALAHGQDALGLPALGGLFSADKLPHLETARLRNRAFMEALYRLSWLSDKTGMVPVNWRAMETEELGSVYESLLELQPQLGDDGKTLVFASEAAEQKGNQRKTTGSYYTPDSLVQALLDTALDPVLDKTEAEAADPAHALLKLSVIDPACGSGHFLLAAARRIATRVARIRAEGTPSLSDFRHALRDVARCCIYGVDRNPMAVELTKVALWIETVDPGLPLGFFDAQIRCGDSLLGVFDLKVLEQGIPDAAYKPLTGDDKEVAKHYAQKNKREKTEKDRIAKGFGFNRARDLMRDFEALRAMPENTVEQIEAKAARLHALTAQGASAWQLETACDLFVSAFLLPKTKGGPHAGPEGMPRRGAEMVPTSGAIWEWLRGVQPFGPMLGAAVYAAQRAHAFHWPLEFPDVMQSGGFDAVLGNPPWERIKLQEKEFFAARDVEIATAPNKAVRDRLIKALCAADPGTAKRVLFEEFEAEKRLSEANSTFVRVPSDDGGRFPLTGTGDVNTYALFAELFSQLGGEIGRAGVIVPTGVATDATTAPFFANLVSEKRLAGLVDFENRERIFPGVYFRVKFCLLTLGHRENAARFAFFLTDPAQLAEPERSFTLSPEQIAAINPNTRTAPVFRSRWDAELTAKIYRNVPVLIDEGAGEMGNPWSVGFMTMFHMSNDSNLFRTAPELEEEGLVRHGTDWLPKGARPGDDDSRRLVPLYEGKMIHQFDHRRGDFALAKERGDADYREIPSPPLDRMEDVSFEITPRYWVPIHEVTARLRTRGYTHGWLTGWRDITNATNERTVIASALPAVAANHKLPLFFTDTRVAEHAALLGNLNSLVLDFVARQKVGGTNLAYFFLRQFPVLPPTFYTGARLHFVTLRVLELTYTSHSLAPFARDLDYDGPPFAWNEDRRANLRADLDVFYSRAYGLTRDELRYILDPADVKGANYPSETFRVLKERELRQFGEYRTRRLVLEAWDRMDADGTFVALGLGVSQVAATAPTTQKPALGTLPDGAWMRAAQQPNDAGAALTAILKAIDGPTPSRTVRLAAAMILEPHLLTSLLPEAQAREWRRLVGQEAEPRSGNVVGFAARTNQGWGTAVSNHRGNGRLIENLSAETWVPGPGLDAFDTAGWPDGRAGFVLEALAALDLDATVTSVPDEVRDWITHAAAA
ncbi:Eco57I restriction-modification methylase domain-containing protein [Methylocystis sp. SC2]|uniref:Eco57I restriction-modification methylase domain-containing protein n=1 Tax=Methylocystis sp. (strain SC2) TaxID=187303 RepID=UPI00027AE9A2|nr:N-6 DNA methylase [Methylocystis sp. SC2]CCJ05602.1 Putative type II DNA modification enzyme [Methylocystis sp. SC2]